MLPSATGVNKWSRGTNVLLASMNESFRRPVMALYIQANMPSGVTTDWNFKPWLPLWPLYICFRWYVGRQVLRKVPSIKPQILLSNPHLALIIAAYRGILLWNTVGLSRYCTASEYIACTIALTPALIVDLRKPKTDPFHVKFALVLKIDTEPKVKGFQTEQCISLFRMWFCLLTHSEKQNGAARAYLKFLASVPF